jgi:alpha/beta superfamily hydrolase
MACFFLPFNDKQIFVNHSLPAKGKAQRAAILFYPFGQEYMRSHKAFRQLANLLTRKNFDVYRFDYPGTGDSSGAAEDSLFSDYLESGHALINFVKQKCYEEIHLVGLRLGALVAAQCFSDDLELNHLVLWDPLMDGKAFFDDCQKHSPDHSAKEDVWNIHGYPLNAAFRSQLLQSSIDKVGVAPHQQLSLLVSGEQDGIRAVERLKQNTRPNFTVVPPVNDWNYVDMVGSILIPADLIREVVNSLANFTREVA